MGQKVKKLQSLIARITSELHECYYSVKENSWNRWNSWSKYWFVVLDGL